MSQHQPTNPESSGPLPGDEVTGGGDQSSRVGWRWFSIWRLVLAIVVLGMLVAAAYLWNAKRLAKNWLAKQERESAQEALVDTLPDGPEHPMDPVIELAEESLDRFRTRVMDYTATMIKQEFVETALLPRLFPRTTMFTRVRNPRKQQDGTRIPLSVYLRYDDPPGQKGREVIWVDGENEGKIIAHEAGLLGFKRLLFPPTKGLAMVGNRYPITEMGIERLLEKMIARGKLDRQYGNCEVQFSRDVPLGELRGVRIVITHPQRSQDHRFFWAEIELETSNFAYLRYAAYDWPPEAGQPAPLLEEYIYQDVKLNPGLVDSAFDPDNPDYNYP